MEAASLFGGKTCEDRKWGIPTSYPEKAVQMAIVNIIGKEFLSGISVEIHAISGIFQNSPIPIHMPVNYDHFFFL